MQALQNSAVKEKVETLERYLELLGHMEGSYKPPVSRSWQHKALECPLVLQSYLMDFHNRHSLQAVLMPSFKNW